VTLDNGLTVVVVALPHLRAGHATVFVRAGPRYEDKATHGLSHLCEHMLFRGSGPWATSQAMAAHAERFHGTLEGVTYGDHVTYGTAFHPSGARDALQMLALLVTRPRFTDLAVERRILLEEVRECFDEKGREVDVDNMAARLLYPDHPAGLSIDGEPGRLRRYTRAHLQAHHARAYVAGNMVLAVAGPVRPPEVLAWARHAFRKLPPGEPLPLPGGPPVPPRVPCFRAVRHAGGQSEVRIAFPALGARDPRSLGLHLLRRVLDDGFTSRFQAELVDRRGLAYELWADVDLAADHGALVFGALVACGKEVRTVRALLAQARALAHKGPTSRELETARRRYGWALEQMYDHAPSAADWHGRGVLWGSEHRPATLLRQSSLITPGVVRGLARELLVTQHAVLAVVGALPRGGAPALRVAMAASRGS
jgi:predicted Zn-dependent peptidase